jgi:hypothetical protein
MARHRPCSGHRGSDRRRRRGSAPDDQARRARAGDGAIGRLELLNVFSWSTSTRRRRFGRRRRGARIPGLPP